MKTLLLLRHAKSSWKDAGRTDDDRSLSRRGKRDAPRMGRLLFAEKLVPDLILSSTARRARKTAAKVARACGSRRDIVFHEELYLATPEAHLAVLRQLKGSRQRVLVVGHNPGLEELLAHLTGVEEHLPTAALAVIELRITRWSALTQRTRGRLVRIYLPREVE